jgi:hypothetical protein
MPKLSEAIGGTKTNLLSSSCRRCVLEVPWTVIVALTKVRNLAKPFKYYKKRVTICYQLRPHVQTYGHPPRYTAFADANAAD